MRCQSAAYDKNLQKITTSPDISNKWCSFTPKGNSKSQRSTSCYNIAAKTRLFTAKIINIARIHSIWQLLSTETNAIYYNNVFSPLTMSIFGMYVAKCRLKPCSHCHRTVRLSHKSETVAENGKTTATVSLLCDSLDTGQALSNCKQHWSRVIRWNRFES